MTTVSATISYTTVKTLSDYFTPMELLGASQVELINNEVTFGKLFYTTNGIDPTEFTPTYINPTNSVIITGNANVRALKLLGDAEESLDTDFTMITTSASTSQYAIGVNLDSLTSLELFPIPIMVRESRPMPFATTSPLVYGGLVGQGFPKTTWILDLSSEQYTQLHDLLGDYQSSECYIVTSLPHARTTFALYHAFMSWPPNPSQYYNPFNGYYIGLPIEFWRMEAVV